MWKSRLKEWKTYLYPLYIFSCDPLTGCINRRGGETIKRKPGPPAKIIREHMGGYVMLKGVNKQVVEVVDMESEYFEKAILFLRAGRPDPGEGVLRQRAGEYLRTIKYRPRQGIDWQRALLAGLAAAGVLLAVGLVVWLSLPLW